MNKTIHEFAKSLTLTCTCLVTVFTVQELKVHAAEPPLVFEPVVDNVMISGPIFLGDHVPHNWGFRVNPQMAVTAQGRALIAWEHRTEVRRTFAVFLDENNTLLNAEPMVFDGIYPKDAATNEDGFILLNFLQDGIVFSKSGEEIESSLGPRRKVASNGGNYLLINRERTTSPVLKDALYGSLIGPDGNIIPGRDRFLILDLHTTIKYEDLISFGDGYLLSYVAIDQDQGRVMRLSGDGAVIDFNVFQTPPSFAGPINYEPPVLATNGGDILYTWNRGESSSPQTIFGAILSVEENAPTPVTFTISGPSDKRGVYSASDGENFLVVWRGRDSPVGTYGSRVTPSGVVLDPGGLLLDEGLSTVHALSNHPLGYMITVDEWADGVEHSIVAKIIRTVEQPSRLDQAQRFPTGGIQFQFNGTPGQSYMIERSENLLEWSELTSFEDFSGQEEVEDTSSSSTGGAFYRAKKQ